MKPFLYQFVSLFISLAILVFFFQLMWILAIPLMITFLSIWGINWMKKRWEKGRVPPSTNKPIRAHQVIDVEYEEIKK